MMLTRATQHEVAEALWVANCCDAGNYLGTDEFDLQPSDVREFWNKLAFQACRTCWKSPEFRTMCEDAWNEGAESEPGETNPYTAPRIEAEQRLGTIVRRES